MSTQNSNNNPTGHISYADLLLYGVRIKVLNYNTNQFFLWESPDTLSDKDESTLLLCLCTMPWTYIGGGSKGPHIPDLIYSEWVVSFIMRIVYRPTCYPFHKRGSVSSKISLGTAEKIPVLARIRILVAQQRKIHNIMYLCSHYMTVTNAQNYESRLEYIFPRHLSLFRSCFPLVILYSAKYQIQYYVIKMVNWYSIYLPRINSLQHWPMSLPSQPSINFWSSFAFSRAICLLARPCIRTPASLKLKDSYI